MVPLRWKIFRLICLLQLMICIVMCGYAGTRTLAGGFSFYFLLDTGVYLAMVLLANMGINIVNNNYPDIPIADRQKKRFNQLFLLNFLLIAFLFAHIFREFGTFSQLRDLFRNYDRALPFTAYSSLLLYSVMLIFQFLILFGLYSLRRLIYANFVNRKFEFEEP